MSESQTVRACGVLGPLYAAGFVTAFGAHAVAANLGGYAAQQDTSLLELGGLLALYDGSEVVLKPVFGAVADRVGPRRVLLGGLLGFALASLAFVAAHNPGLLAVTRLAQGMSTAAFSPAAGALVARHGGRRQGRSSAAMGRPRASATSLAPCSVAPWSWLAGIPCSSLSSARPL